jgi:hypothetical protein
MVYAARPLERLSLIAQSVFPPAREIARQYGIPRRRRLIYLLYAKRWKDLLLKYGASAWRCLTGPESEAAALRKGQERGFFMDWLHSVD